MTCREKLAIEHPDLVGNNYSAGCFGCPYNYGYMEKPDYCYNEDDYISCTECWDREIQEKTNRVCNCYDPEYKRCNGTKEQDKCSCEGIKSRCDFYPEKRVETEKKNIYDKFETSTKILDSGNRREFETGAVRDIQEGKGRCDLMPMDVVSGVLGSHGAIDTILHDIYLFQMTGDASNLYYALDCFIGADARFTMILEVSKHFEEGAKKYGEYNWQKGIPTNCYIDSAVRHYLKFLRGDKDEHHDRAFVWNLMCCIWTCNHKPELNVYGREKES